MIYILPRVNQVVVSMDNMDQFDVKNDDTNNKLMPRFSSEFRTGDTILFLFLGLHFQV